jgi:hypothetical protein
MPLDRGIIDQQLHSLRESSLWWERRELRDLPAVLHPDERILAIARGKIARVRLLRRSWLIVVTDERLLCLRSQRNSWNQLEVGADQITRVAMRVGPFRGRVLVTGGGHTYRLLVPRPAAYKLLTALSTLGPRHGDAFSGFAPTRMVRRVMDHVLALPAAALTPYVPAPPPAAAPDTSAIDDRFEALEAEVQALREQVDFLEQLLRERHSLSVAPVELESDERRSPGR